jgi:phosphatidylinositol dimannoside acyltransferase
VTAAEPAPQRSDARFDSIGVAGYRLASVAARNLPGPVTAAGASLLGIGFAQSMRSRREMVERHLLRVSEGRLRGPALRRTVQAAFDSYARYWVETFRLPWLTAEAVDAGFSYDGYGQIADALEAGTGAIVALPHLGGWEWAGRWVADRGHPITVVVEPLSPPEVFEWFVGLRRSLGMTVVPLGPHAAGAVARAIASNQIVCLLCDRDLTGGGVPVRFFGETTKLPAGPALLGLRTGAPVFPTAVYFTGHRDGHLGLVRPPLPLTREGSLREDVARTTQQLAFELEELIRRAPEQWHLFQPNWPSDPGYGT